MPTASLFKVSSNDVYEMIVSPAHFKEIEAIEEVRERLKSMALPNTCGWRPTFDLRKMRKRAEQLHSLQFGVVDAAEVAFAEATADFFISCDDRLWKRCRKNRGHVLSLTPVEFCIPEDPK